MANFTDRAYPWPTDPKSSVLPETGGNTRLLFAEQDNYRTRKGSPGSGTQSSAESNAFSFTDSNSLFYGVYADEGQATNGIDAGLNTSIYYYNEELKQFRRFTAGNVFEDIGTANPVSTIMNRSINLIFDADNNVEYADAAEASDNLGVDTDIAEEDVYYIYYNSADSTVHKVTAFTASQAATGAGDIFYVIPRVVSADIAETTENIPIEFLKGSLSANKAQAGPLAFGNGFSIAASEEGLQLFLRTMAQSRKDNIVDTADANAAEVTHIAAGTSLATVHTSAQNFITDKDIPSGNTVQLIVTPVSIGESGIVELQIDGYDHEGTGLREIMILTSANNTKPVTTDFYFAKPPTGGKTTYQVNRAATGASFKITSKHGGTTVVFSQPSDTQNQDLLPGWTIEVRKGSIPFTYVGVLPNEISIALARDTALQMDMTVIAFDSLPYTDIEGNEVNVQTGKGSRGIDISSGTPYGGGTFDDASETIFTGWQAYLDLIEPGTGTPVRVPLTDATFTINHQLEQAQLIVGDRRPGPPFRSALREVMLDGTMLFTRERDWVALFRNNVDFKNPVMVLRNAPAGGFPYELRVEFGVGQLMTSPDPQVGDIGLITQAFNMKFRESASGKSDDFKFTIYTDKWRANGGLRVDGAYA